MGNSPITQCIITQDFVKHLAAYYDEINIEEKELEIIFVSLEKTEEDFKRFTEGMPWLVLPFNDVRTGDLKEFYKIRSLPQVIGKYWVTQSCSQTEKQ